jgi:hypothetical protein
MLQSSQNAFSVVAITDEDKTPSNYSLPSSLPDGEYTLTTIKVQPSKTKGSKRLVLHASYENNKGAMRMTIILFSMLIQGMDDNAILSSNHAKQDATGLSWVVHPNYKLTKAGDKVTVV